MNSIMISPMKSSCPNIHQQKQQTQPKTKPPTNPTKKEAPSKNEADLKYQITRSAFGVCWALGQALGRAGLGELCCDGMGWAGLAGLGSGLGFEQGWALSYALGWAGLGSGLGSGLK